MEDTKQQDGFAAAAADVGASEPARQKRKRTARKPDAQQRPADTPAQDPVVQVPAAIEIKFDGVKPEQLRAATAPFLKAIARASGTTPPTQEESDALAETLAFGLSHTKIAVSDKAGPWVPLAIFATAYAVPRAIEKLMATFGEPRPEVPEQGATFRPEGEVEAVVSVEAAQVAPDTGIPAIGARRK